MIHNRGRTFSGSVRMQDEPYVTFQVRNYLEPIPLSDFSNASRRGTFRVYASMFEEPAATVQHGFTFRFGRDNATYEVGGSSRQPVHKHIQSSLFCSAPVVGNSQSLPVVSDDFNVVISSANAAMNDPSPNSGIAATAVISSAMPADVNLNVQEEVLHP